jgi:hypothetical protein
MYQWLHETDRALKGSHSDNRRARFALESLFLKMAPRAAGRPSTATGNPS